MPRASGRSQLHRLRFPIETPRLLLRPPSRRDLAALVPLVGDSRVSRPTLIPHPYSLRDGQEFLARAARNRRRGTDIPLLIFSRQGGRLVGGTGLHAIDWRDRRFELGYWIAPSEWGKGIATEAAYAVCRAAFTTLGLHRAQANVFSFNPRSGRVLRKIGFRREGTAREYRRRGRTWVDEWRFGLLARELRRPPSRP